LEAEICLSYRNEREAETVTKAISPDNMELPKGLQIETIQHDSEVNTKIKCQTRLATLIATIDDLLACVSVAEKSFKIAKQ
jgi:hypothetical protein